MNKIRRQQLRKWLEEMEAIKNELESICSDEEDYFENMPENLQGSDRGMTAEEAIDKMNDAVAAIEEAVECVEEII